MTHAPYFDIGTHFRAVIGQFDIGTVIGQRCTGAVVSIIFGCERDFRLYYIFLGQ